jgi:hypothetical protein
VHYLRVGDVLWKHYDDIKLVRVSPDAESAFFTRVRAGVESREEELLKGSMQMGQAVLMALREGRESGRATGAVRVAPQPAAPAGRWIEVDETQRQGNTWHIGRKDENIFGEDADRFLERIHADSYRSSYDPNIRGVVVRNIDSGLAQRYGIQQNDVLLSLNGEPVRTKAEAFNKGKEMYNRGVRTFVARFLSGGGQIVERTYQAPDR